MQNNFKPLRFPSLDGMNKVLTRYKLPMSIPENKTKQKAEWLYIY